MKDEELVEEAQCLGHFDQNVLECVGDGDELGECGVIELCKKRTKGYVNIEKKVGNKSEKKEVFVESEPKVKEKKKIDTHKEKLKATKEVKKIVKNEELTIGQKLGLRGTNSKKTTGKEKPVEKGIKTAVKMSRTTLGSLGKVDFMRGLIAKGTMTRKEILKKVAEKFPESSVGSSAAILSNGVSKIKGNPFGKPEAVKKGKDGILHF